MWRVMTEADMEAVSVLSDAVHGRYTEPPAVYAERRRLYPAGCFVFDRGAGIEGYLISHPWICNDPPPLGALIGAIPVVPNSFYLHDLALLPSARGTGAGVAAVDLVRHQAMAMGLNDITLVAVGGAEAFWHSRGFEAVPDPAIATYVRDAYGPEALYMRRHLLSS